MTEITDYIRNLRQALINDIYNATGASRQFWKRMALWPLVWPPAQRFASISANFEQDMIRYGLIEAAQRLLHRFVSRVNVQGYQEIPSEGPLLVASNHPGTYDALAIVSHLPRDDIKVVVQGFPFLQRLKWASEHFIFAPPDIQGRMGTLRAMIRHLQQEGSLLVFPTGKLDPDPAVLPGAEAALLDWSPSLEMILRKVPQTQVLVTVVSGVLSPRSLSSPFTRLSKDWWMKQRIAEFVQVAQQVLLNRKYDLSPLVTFDNPISIEQFGDWASSFEVLGELIERARNLLNCHTAKYASE